jgi:hypothetical protein
VNVNPVVVGNVELVIFAALVGAFVVVYGATTRWWEGHAGANMMAFMFILALVSALGVVHILLDDGDARWFLWLRVGVFALAPVVAGWRLWLLIRTQVLTPRDPDDG